MFYYGQKREPRENYFPVHNRIFDLGFCAEELAIYLYLVRCEDKKTFTCYPSHATIGLCIGRTANTVQKYVKELEKKTLITTELTMVRSKNGRYCNSSRANDYPTATAHSGAEGIQDESEIEMAVPVAV